MSEFSNITVVKRANVYFDGRVTSRTLRFADGSVKTLGYMLPGEYTFNTADAELMEVLAGELELSLSDQPKQTITAGQSFSVPANSSFTVNISNGCDYCCSFIK